MAKVNYTDNSAHTISQKARKVLITINTGFTGTLTVTDGSTAVAVITNPATGGRYEYWDFTTSVVVTASATGDYTVNTDGSFGPK